MPKVVADDYQTIRPHLFFWQVYDPQMKVDLSSCAIVIAGQLVFIDPVPLAEGALRALCLAGTPAAIVLTNGNHERAAAAYRDEFSIPIHAHNDAREASEVKIDRLLADDARVLDALQVVPLKGAGPGEIALHSPADDGIMMIGDALVNIGPQGIAILPDKYCTSAADLRASLPRLLNYSFATMTFAHGLPLATKAAERVAQLLAPK